MPRKLINLNQDLKKLEDEGYVIEIRGDHLLVHEIPYVNSKCQIKYGILVSDLTSMAGDQTVSPVTQHVAHFIGEYPCNSDGTQISTIFLSSQNQLLAENLEINHSFSSKPTPPIQYVDYHEKMTTYVAIISSQAKAIDELVTEKLFKTVDSCEEENVFNYRDTKSKIGLMSSKLRGQKIAIIGLGGTGSYLLDFIAKTPVQEIHLFDGDIFLNHNAFRSPGAPSVDELRKIHKKSDYFRNIYANMHKNIFSHNYFVSASNVDELSEMNFVFISLDNSNIKKTVIDYLITKGISFIDVGMGILNIDDSLIGHIRTTTSTIDKRDHIGERISLSEDNIANDYSTNIQIADLNALNATLAIIKWKKLNGFYQDLSQEFNTTYSINDGKLFNEDYIA